MLTPTARWTKKKKSRENNEKKSVKVTVQQKRVTNWKKKRRNLHFQLALSCNSLDATHFLRQIIVKHKHAYK